MRAAVHAALNGDRVHPATPRTPKQLAAEVRAAVDAGAVSVHLHPYDQTGEQTLGAEPCAMALRAVRVSCPGIPVSLSTSAGIEPDPRRRLELIAGWSELPELVTANQGEDGIIELCQLLLARGVGIEAGLLSLADARSFVASGLASRCARALIEPLDPEPETAVAHAVAIEQTLADAEVRIEQVHHGDGIASWAVNAAPPHAATASEPDSRTHRCCRTGVRQPETENSSQPPWHCSTNSRQTPSRGPADRWTPCSPSNRNRRRKGRQP